MVRRPIWEWLRPVVASFIGFALPRFLIGYGMPVDRWAEAAGEWVYIAMTTEQAGWTLSLIGAFAGLAIGAYWPHIKVRIQRTQHDLGAKQNPRISQVKKRLRGLASEADEMHDNILAEKVATQSLPEGERRVRLSVYRPPECRRWHTNVEALVEKELGRAQAHEFASDYKHLEADAHDWIDLDFLMKFLSRKRSRLRDIANRITETDLE